jgi:PAS domain-containing protein
MGESMEVLFVCEHPRTRATAEQTFPRHAPLSVTTVSSAAAALDSLSESAVDCVVTTHEADGTDGLQVLRLIRDADPAIPVVLFEDSDADSVASDAISHDVTEYVERAAEDDPFAVLARTCYDATSTYRAEQDVAMLNDLARNVYERITDGFFALDRDWRFTYMNDAAEDILEADSDALISRNVWDAFPEAVGTKFYTEYHRAMAAQEPVTFKEYFDPLEKTFEVRAFPSEDGLSVHFRAVVDDEDESRGDHLMELTTLLSADLTDSIEELRGDLEAAETACSCDVDHLADAQRSLDRMADLVNYSIQLTRERPLPPGEQKVTDGEDAP